MKFSISRVLFLSLISTQQTTKKKLAQTMAQVMVWWQGGGGKGRRWGRKEQPNTCPSPLPSLQVSSKLPQHLQLSPRLPPTCKRTSPLPAGHTRESSLSSEFSEGSSLLVQPIKSITQTQTEVQRPESIEEQPCEPVKEMSLDETQSARRGKISVRHYVIKNSTTWVL